jgi:hypothetical protein
MKIMAIVLGQPLCSNKLKNDAFGHFSIIGKAIKLKDMKPEKWGTYLKKEQPNTSQILHFFKIHNNT